MLQEIIKTILHLDVYLNSLIQNYGVWTYLILFGIIFAETGLVVTPFLPGDSLLFAAGAFAASGAFNIFWLFVILASAAIIGDSVNYAVGHFFGEKLFKNEKSKIFKKEYLERTHEFYSKYGGKTIIIARFVPIIRTFAPFVAGVGRMSYGRFFIYNVVGGLLWVTIFAIGGFYFGNIPVVKKNFSLFVIIIIIVSVIPAVTEILKARKKAKKETAA
ncbi:MAG: DedA family protein [Candidatus Omnitrophica bacterium]|nr:DedA family protein [Candidatus Omnitrophota bacterium]